MSRRPRPVAERGQVLVIFALLAGVLFSLVGLAVDAGHGYVAQRATQSAGDAAGLAGAGMLGNTLQDRPPSTGGACDPAGVVQQALNAAALNGQTTVAATRGCAGAAGTYCGAASRAQYDFTFYSGAVNCAAPSASIGIQISIPPSPNPGADCSVQSGAQYNCIQVSITSRIRNYIEGLIGIPSTTVRTVSAAFARPSPGIVPLPAPNAVTLWKQDGGSFPDWASSYVPCFGKKLTVTGERSPGGTATAANVIAGLGADWTVRPSLTTCARTAIDGVDGAASAYAPYNAADAQTVIGEGSLVFGANTILCDPFGGKRCPAPEIPSPDGNGTTVCGAAPYTGACGTYSVGALGYALPVSGAIFCTTYGDTTSNPLGQQNAAHPCQVGRGGRLNGN